MTEDFPLRHTPKPFPFSLLLFAVFCAALGGLGVLSGAWSAVSSYVSGPSDLSGTVDEALREVGQIRLPTEYRHLLDDLNQDDAFRERLLGFTRELSDMTPLKPLFNLTSFVLSLLSLLVGIGLLARREWARRLSIAFLVLATLSAVAWGYAILPGFMRVLNAYVGLHGGGLGPETEGIIRTYWLILWVSLALLHGLLVAYLNGERIRRVFRVDPEA